MEKVTQDVEKGASVVENFLNKMAETHHPYAVAAVAIAAGLEMYKQVMTKEEFKHFADFMGNTLKQEAATNVEYTVN